MRSGFRAGYLHFKLNMNVVVQTFEPSLQNFTKSCNFGRRKAVIPFEFLIPLLVANFEKKQMSYSTS